MKKLAADRFFCPRLSEATRLLPLISGHLVAAASRRPLGAALELWPIVEDGLFGYELVPDREAHTYLIMACNAQREPVLRRTSYSVGAHGALQLVAVNGHLLSRSERAARYSIRRRDSVFPDWVAAAESACAQLRILFPNRTQQSGVVRERVHRCLEEALRVAYSHLVRWDPFIEFFGLPNEAQLGFRLMGAGGEHGELIFQEADMWTLRWNAPSEVVHELWSIPEDSRALATDRGHREFHLPDRRTHCRRAMDRGNGSGPWSGEESRQTRRRRTMDQHKT